MISGVITLKQCPNTVQNLKIGIMRHLSSKRGRGVPPTFENVFQVMRHLVLKILDISRIFGLADQIG